MHRVFLTTGLVLSAPGLERVLNSYLLGRVPHASMRLVIGLAGIGIGVLLLSMGLLVFRARRGIPGGPT